MIAPRSRALAFLLLLTLPAAVGAIDISENQHISFQNEFLYYNNAVSGGNANASFLSPGRFFTDDVHFMDNVKRGDLNWETAMDGREATDPRVELHRYNLKRFYSKVSDPLNEGVVGDFLGSLSQYTLNTSLKGAQYTRHLSSGTVDLTALYGTPKSNWDDLWNHNAQETVDRQAFGLRGLKRFGGDAALGASFVESADNRARYITSAVLVDQRVFGVDWALPRFHDFWFHGESAYSKTHLDNPTTTASGQEGRANLVKGEYSHGPFQSRTDFERVTPDFNTVNGSASPDLLRYTTENRLKLVGPWSLLANYTWFHNNLTNDDAAPVTKTALPEAGFRFEGPLWRPSLAIESKFRYRMVTTSTTGLRDRTRAIANDVTDRFGPVSAQLDYEFQHEDKSDGTASARHHILGAGLGGFFDPAPGWHVTPNLHWTLQRDRDNVVATTDQTHVVTANLTVNTPYNADANVGYQRSLILNAVNPSADRRSFNAVIGYNVQRHGDYRLEARFTQNDNRFTSINQDFKEKVGALYFKMGL